MSTATIDAPPASAPVDVDVSILGRSSGRTDAAAAHKAEGREEEEAAATPAAKRE
jgi:hypothetical protein